VVKIMYIRNIYYKPVGCLAMDINNNTIHYQISTQNPADKWNKKLARTIALARLDNKSFVIPNVDTTNHSKILNLIMNDLVKNYKTLNIPKRIVECAKYWLDMPFF